MPRGGANFSSAELAEVLSHYDIGVIHQIKPLSAGNRKTPKMIITSKNGKFLLKRKPKGKDDIYRVAFAHQLQSHLAEKGFAVTKLIQTKDEKNTILQINNHIYECFNFVNGIRYNGSAKATTDAGRQLAGFHKFSADFACERKPLRASFHDSSSVRRHLKTLGSEKKSKTTRQFRLTLEDLMTLYTNSAIHVNELGFDSWTNQVVHSDWHPGNMLFDKNKIVAILDFDSVRIAPPITDLANGMLQFSIVGNRPEPADWPDYLDQAKLIQFLNGYRQIIDLEKRKAGALLDLMIETIIAEAILPIVATGFFANFSGPDFLKMIARKAKWINKNRKNLNSAIRSL